MAKHRRCFAELLGGTAVGQVLGRGFLAAAAVAASRRGRDWKATCSCGILPSSYGKGERAAVFIGAEQRAPLLHLAGRDVTLFFPRGDLRV